MERRDLLKAGLYGFSGLSLGDLHRQRAYAIDHAAKPGDAIRHSMNRLGESTAIIMVWLRGGCSHVDTWVP